MVNGSCVTTLQSAQSVCPAARSYASGTAAGHSRSLYVLKSCFATFEWSCKPHHTSMHASLGPRPAQLRLAALLLNRGGAACSPPGPQSPAHTDTPAAARV